MIILLRPLQSEKGDGKRANDGRSKHEMDFLWFITASGKEK